MTRPRFCHTRAKWTKRREDAAKRIAALRGKLVDLQRRADNTTDAIGDADSERVRDRLTAKLDQLDAEEKQAKAELADIEAEHTKLTSAATDLTQWRADFEGLVKALSNPEIRGLAKPHLRKLIDKIEIFAQGLPNNYDHILDALDYWIPPKRATKEKADAFKQWLIHGCNSKRGRFLRVTFTTSKSVDLVPAGSFAEGSKLVGLQKRWYSDSPNLKRLWETFSKNWKSN